jgi:hypothetical protein
MKTNKYAKIFAIITQINKAGGAVTKERLARDFSNGRTTSLSDLSVEEFQELESALVKMAPGKPAPIDYSSDKLDKSRKAIIAQFRSIGRTAEQAISWAESKGVFGNKRKFNDYTGQELHQLIKNAEKVKTGFIKSANKKLRVL